MRKNNKKGFTLVELVIVVAVMAVLVAVAIPTIGSITGKAKDAVAESNARTIESIVKLAEADADGAAVPAATLAKAIYDAKLGITSEDENDTFNYDPTTGSVTVDGTGGTTIAFGADGKVTVTPNGGSAATYPTTTPSTSEDETVTP